jgi:hypothetical protein
LAWKANKLALPICANLFLIDAMISNRIAVVLALCTGWLCNAHAAAEFQYYVYPVGGITGISQSAIKTEQTGPKYGGMINDKYADLFFDAETQRALIKSFQDGVAQKFPTSVVGANQIRTSKSGKYAYQPYEVADCRPGFTVNYKDSFAIAIGISRLSTYFNTYSDFTQVLVPITYTVRFVKLNGASVVFSKSETIYSGMTAPTAGFFMPGTQEIRPENIAKLKAAILTDGLQMVQRHVDAAAKGFTPKQSEIAIAAKDGNYFIFNNGSEVGFSSGEDFDAVNDKGEEFSFSVEYASNGIAVAVASDFTPEIKRATNRLRQGDKLTFSFTKQGKDDAKPSVLAVQYTPAAGARLTDRQVLDNALLSIVADDIGFKAPFNLIKHDADFSRLKNQIRGEANCESTMYQDMNGFADNSTKSRVNPDLYLKLDAYSSPVFTAVGVGGATSKSIFSNSVTLSLVDRSSIVNQVFFGSNPYELSRTGGKGLDNNQANEINLKNAALASMQSMLSGFTLTPKTVGIKSVANGVITLTQPVSLTGFNQAKIVRPLKAGSSKTPVLMPLQGSVAQLVKPTQDTDKIEIKGDVRASDLILLGATDVTNKPLKFCDDTRKRHFLMTPSLTHPSWGDGVVSRVIPFKVKGYNFVETHAPYLDSVQLALRDGFFSNTDVPKSSDTPFCVVAQEVQQLVKNECVADKCAGTATVASGVRIYEGSNKIGESIIGAKFDFSEIKPDALSQFVGVKAYEHQLNSISQHKSKLH